MGLETLHDETLDESSLKKTDKPKTNENSSIATDNLNQFSSNSTPKAIISQTFATH